MPNLVGIGNSQAPTNAMLGGLAYQDSVGEINIDKIKAKASGTATDIFVYDTRKDSDGGAWRKRTQHTSWYNEGVSDTRGARKEFPAVAVIVAEQNFITIYDGDDPNLPMWMVFNTISPDGTSQGMGIPSQAGRPMLQLQGVDKVVHMLNGILVTGTKNEGSNYGQPIINFINEKVLRMDSQGGEGGEWIGNIAQRNESLGYRHVTHDYVIKASHVNDVAMTVLPNAPIDETTGLPIPTIAVATEGGVSVINDDGTVFDTVATTSGYVSSRKVEFSDSGEYLYIIQDPSLIYSYKTSSFTTDRSSGTLTGYAALSFFSGWVSSSGPASSTKLTRGNNTTINIGHTNTGLSLLYPDYSYSSNGLDNASGKLICRVTKDFNTGWMHGDIKGAFMSDTDTTNLTDTQAVTNPGPFTSTTGWAAANAGWSVSDSNNRLVINSGSQTSSYFGAAQTLTLVDGRKYVLVVNIHSQTKTAVIRLTADGNYFTTTGLGTGEHSFYFTANQASHSIFIGSDTGGSNREQQVSSVTIREVEEDRSVNDKGLQVFGTITKSKVATGAELVSYGPFTDSNYLKQSYNSDLNFGSDGFSLSIWIKPAANTPYMRIVNRVQDTNDRRWELYTDNTVNNIVFYTRDNAQASYVNVNDAIPINIWTHVFAVREQNGDLKVYINGVLGGTALIGSSDNPAKRGLTSTTATLLVGNAVGWDNDNPFNGQLAFLKISASIPSPEQIKKIYSDEKCLFHEEAKCTLSGTSDAITGLGFDDTTNVLHVGTSSGRSEFQGLNRINNTTTAVTTEISASDGLVAEQ